ncbi:MAG: type II toxin-antitoxin system prevent-host-death family antitoxin [Firmicutes bacterium]|nr:type II toxin-antitoxin system prevent-host-death family antitoxin [Bacillota bacterium]
MTITATEFKKNLGKYMQLALSEDVYITKNGTVLVKMSNPNKDKVDILNSLVGAAADNGMTVDEIKAARLERQ